MTDHALIALLAGFNGRLIVFTFVFGVLQLRQARREAEALNKIWQDMPKTGGAR
jgi:hypothetical protein